MRNIIIYYYLLHLRSVQATYNNTLAIVAAIAKIMNISPLFLSLYCKISCRLCQFMTHCIFSNIFLLTHRKEIREKIESPKVYCPSLPQF